MCGLFGFNGDSAVMNQTMARLAANKLKILGLFNIDRGKHSCGLYINDQIMKGVNDEKLFSDFLAKYILPDATKTGNYNIIGHTRAATTGSHTADNAHPFVVNDNLVLAHNGVIRNIWALGHKYKVDTNGLIVDSHVLAHLIDERGFKPILEEYEGFAALLMAFKNEPNAMYIYRGASRIVKGGELKEERPLYYLSTHEGIYLSSIEKSLSTISDSSDDTIGIVPYNIVHKIVNGRITSEQIIIERGDINVATPYVHSPNTNGTTRTGGTSSANKTGTTTTTPTLHNSVQTNCSIGRSYSGSSNTLDIKTVPMIWHETLPNRISRWKLSTGIIYHQGRYWIIDHDEIRIAHGSYYISRKGKVLLEKKDGHNYYFFEGVMMKNKANYQTAILDPNIANPNWNFAMFISRYSEYPVAITRSDSNTRCKEVAAYSKYRWYHDEAMCGNFGFTPKFSERHYTIKEGLMDRITCIKTAIANEVCIDAESLAAERKSLIDSFGSSLLKPPYMRVVTDENQEDVIRQRVVRTLKEVKDALKQNELPFSEEGKSESDLSLENFYLKFSSIKEAKEILSAEEDRAIRYYISDIMNDAGLAQIMNVYDENVDVQMNLFLDMCIENDVTLVDNWDNKNYKDILTYLLIARENPEGDIYDDYEEEADEAAGISVEEFDECCVNIPKPIMTPDLPYGWICTEEGVIADPKDDEEPTPIELAIQEAMQAKAKFEHVMGNKTEDAEVPHPDETFHPVPNLSGTFDDNKEERDYCFGEIINNALRMREEADELQAIDDDFSQEVACKIYLSVDSLMAELVSLTEEHQEFELRSELLRNLKTRTKS